MNPERSNHWSQIVQDRLNKKDLTHGELVMIESFFVSMKMIEVFPPDSEIFSHHVATASHIINYFAEKDVKGNNTQEA